MLLLYNISASATPSTCLTAPLCAVQGELGNHFHRLLELQRQILRQEQPLGFLSAPKESHIPPCFTSVQLHQMGGCFGFKTDKEAAIVLINKLVKIYLSHSKSSVGPINPQKVMRNHRIVQIGLSDPQSHPFVPLPTPPSATSPQLWNSPKDGDPPASPCSCGM